MSPRLLSLHLRSSAARHVELGDERRLSDPQQEELRELPKLSPQAAIRLGRQQAFNDIRSAIPFILLDMLAVFVALIIAQSFQFALTGQSFFISSGFLVGVTAMTLLLQQIHGLYPACGLPISIEFRQILRTGALVAAAIALGRLIYQPINNLSGPISQLNWIGLTAFSVSLTFMLSSSRPITRKLLARFDWWTQPVLIVGGASQAMKFHERLVRYRHEGLRSAGILYDPEDHWNSDAGGDEHSYIGPRAELEFIMLSEGICRVAIVESGESRSHSFSQLQGVPHVMLPIDMGFHPTEKSRLTERDGRTELHCCSSLTSPFSRAVKRSMDVALVLGTSPLWLPLMITIALIIKLTDPGHVFYKQSRIGRFRRPFKAIKFRSMVSGADEKLKVYLDTHPELQKEWEESHKLKDDPRITRIGAFLRKTSLDELPQLINVLIGEMSLVGPRPIIDCDQYDRRYIDGYPEVFELYQMVQPGITGLWQISGRNSLPYDKRVELDRFYLYNWSVLLDVFILWRTLKTALFREGAY